MRKGEGRGQYRGGNKTPERSANSKFASTPLLLTEPFVVLLAGLM